MKATVQEKHRHGGVMENIKNKIHNVMHRWVLGGWMIVLQLYLLNTFFSIIFNFYSFYILF